MKVIASLLLSLALALPLHAQDEKDEDLSLLTQRSVPTDTASLCQVLTDLAPSKELSARIKAAIALLGHRRYGEREKASATLARIGQPARSALEGLKETPDLEVRYRVQSLLRYLESGEALVTIAAAARVLGKRKDPVAFDSLITAIAHAPSDQVSRTAEIALRGVSGEAQLPALRARLKDDLPRLRAAAARVLSHVSKDRKAEMPLLRPLLTDKSSSIRLAAAEAVARLGSPACLPPLLGLLEHDDVMVRANANALLRRATGKDHKFVAYDDPKPRNEAVGRWKAWYDKTKGDVVIQDVLADPLGVHLGRIMYCMLSPNKIIELNAQGKQSLSITTSQYAWGLAARRNGHRVYCEYSRKRLIEVDVKGKKVWEFTGLPNGPQGIDVLPNGNILVACANSDTVVEVSRKDKKIVWTRKLKGRPCDIHMLENGRMLVALQRLGKVVEIDRAGRELWSKTGLSYPMSAKRLPNGNTLIAEMSRHRAVEVNRAGKIVWTSPRVISPYDAERLPDGRTLIAHRRGLIEYDKKGKKTREFPGRNVTRVISW